MNKLPPHRKTQFSNSVNFAVYEFIKKLSEFWISRMCSTVTVIDDESWCLPLTQIIRMQIVWLFVNKFHLICKCLTMRSVSCPTKCIIPYLLSLSSATSCTVCHKLVLLTCSDKINIATADSLYL